MGGSLSELGGALQEAMRPFEEVWQEFVEAFNRIFDNLDELAEEISAVSESITEGPDPLFKVSKRPKRYFSRYDYIPTIKRNEPYMRRDNYYGRT